jgi:uncharacterized protein (DUF4415 family)
MQMNARLLNTAQPWVDPDDAAELTATDFERGVWSIGDKIVTKEVAQASIAKRVGRPLVEMKRPVVSIRLEPYILEHLRASGKGWQTKVNALLREAIEQGRF